jgi:arylsulfatase A-like enzyme
MAAQGIRFADFHSNGPLCTPTRAALLTGRYQQRDGVDGVHGGGDLLPLSAITIARRLRGTPRNISREHQKSSVACDRYSSN